MTKSLVTGPLQHTTDGQFRAWGSQIGQQLQAVGLVKTGDTGQVDWTTATRPSAGTTDPNYEIYRFDDALQATTPIFIKIEYGTSSASSTLPAMRVAVGTGSNGTGGLLGQVLVGGLDRGPNEQPSAASTHKSYACRIDSGFMFVGFTGAFGVSQYYPSAPLSFGVFRPVDEAGSPTAEGCVLYYANGAAMSQQVYSKAKGGVTVTNNNDYCFVPYGLTTGVVGTDVQVFRHTQAYPRLRTNLGLLTYFQNDISQLTEFPAQPAGQPHTYLSLGDHARNANASAVYLSPSLCAAMVWE